MSLQSPYPFIGGKRKALDLVWPRLGADVPNYIEPFFGSGAIFWGRPGGAGKIETVNDINGGIVNFLRAIAFGNEQAVAEWCDWPVSELDLHARHDWILQQLAELEPRLRSEPECYDEKLAGWWCWGACIWLGAGWGVTPKRQTPRVTATGTGTTGVIRSNNHKRPELRSAGKGVMRAALRKPSIGNDRGVHGVDAMNTYEWFAALKNRSRNTRILCGDWKRVVTPAVLGFGKNVGGRRPTAVFLDPPYVLDGRAKDLYANDPAGLFEEVRDWAVRNGETSELRIALCGYADASFSAPHGWEEVAWKGGRGFAGADNRNRELERIWFSPGCLKPRTQRTLFDSLKER